MNSCFLKLSRASPNCRKEKTKQHGIFHASICTKPVIFFNIFSTKTLKKITHVFRQNVVISIRRKSFISNAYAPKIHSKSLQMKVAKMSDARTAGIDLLEITASRAFSRQKQFENNVVLQFDSTRYYRNES